MDDLEKGSTSDQRIDELTGYHMPGTELRASAHRHRSAGAHLTHLLDHESPPSPCRPPESSRPSPGGPSSTSDRCASRLSAAAAWLRAVGRRVLASWLLLACVGLLAADAQAQTVQTLVSNTGQTPAPDKIFGVVGPHVSGDVTIGAQGFTTGDSEAGYTLSSVDLYLTFFGTPEVTVSIYEADASGDPGSSLYILTTPALVDGLHTFTAPANATLVKETKYFVVMESGGTSWITDAFVVRMTDTDDEDSGAASGWSIANASRFRCSPCVAFQNDPVWDTDPLGLQLRISVKGTVRDGTTLSTDATLSALALSGVTLDPTFASATEDYTATVGNAVMQTTVTATPTHSGATVAFKDGDDNALTNPVTLAVGANVIKAVVTAEDTTTMKTNMVTVTRATTTTVPGAPTGLTATASGTTTIDLTWTAPADDGGSAITGYRIEVSPNGTSSWTNRVANTGTTSTSYSHTGLSAGTTRHYRVSAINANGTGAASSTDNATTGTTTDPGPLVLTVEAVEDMVTEGEPVRYRILMSRRTSGAVVQSSFSYKGDFVRNPNSVVVGGVSSHGGKLYWEIGYETLDDAIEEKDGSFTVTIRKPDRTLTGGADLYSHGEAYTVGSPSSATVTIMDNDPEDTPTLPIVSVEDARVKEGPDAELVFPARLNVAPVETARIHWQTLDGANSTGAKAGEDYVGASGTLVFAPGETVKTIRVEVLDDTQVEGTEVMLLYLTGAENAVIDDALMKGTIEDNDDAAAAAAAAEGLTPDDGRGSGRPGRKSIRAARRRGRFAGYALATLLAVTMTLSCTEGSVGPAANVQDPGFLTVEWTGPAAGRGIGVLLELEGPGIEAVRAPGFELYESRASGRHEIVVAGSLRAGPLVQFRVPDRGQLPLYRVRVLEVAGEDYELRDAGQYRAVITLH